MRRWLLFFIVSISLIVFIFITLFPFLSIDCSVVWCIIRPGRGLDIDEPKKSKSSSKLSKLVNIEKFGLFWFKFDVFGFMVDGIYVEFDIIDFIKPFLLIFDMFFYILFKLWILFK